MNIIQTKLAEKALKDAADWVEVEEQAALYDSQKGDENDFEVTLAYDMVSEKLLKDRLEKMKQLINAKEQAAKNLHSATIEYEKKNSYPDEKKFTVIEHLIATIRAYDKAGAALKAIQ